MPTDMGNMGSLLNKQYQNINTLLNKQLEEASLVLASFVSGSESSHP